jgi:hypothetical protein
MPARIPDSFNAFVVREGPAGRSAGFETLPVSELPDGELLVEVPERQPHADFARALGDEISQHAVDAERREQ